MPSMGSVLAGVVLDYIRHLCHLRRKEDLGPAAV
jgi:hypothetical protein